MSDLSLRQRHALDALLSSSPFAGAATELGRRFAAAGHELYLVGGTVRDALLDRASPDVDFTTDAHPDRVSTVLAGWRPDAVWMQGARYGTVGARKGGVQVEITTFRSDVYRHDSRKPEVTFGRRIEDDLERRDFTINAMAVRLPDRSFIDPYGGLADLAQRRLRTPSAPETSFDDDPLRMLRAARFVSQLGVTPTAETVAALSDRAGRLAIVARERIRDELDKLLLGADPGGGVRLCLRAGLAAQFLPELPALALEQDPVHRHKDVLAHSVAVLERAAGAEPGAPDLRLRLAALLHDIGKPRTRRFGPEGVTFHHHENEGARLAGQRLRELRYPAGLITDVTELIRLHMRFHGYSGEWTDSAVRRYVHDAGGQLQRLNLLVRSDCTTRNPAKARRLASRMDQLERRIAELAEAEDLARRAKPAIDGHEVMRLLDVPPGPVVGRAMRHLSETRLDRGPMTPDETRAELFRWAKNEGLVD